MNTCFYCKLSFPCLTTEQYGSTLLPEVHLIKTSLLTSMHEMSAHKCEYRPSGSNQRCAACLVSTIWWGLSTSGMKLNPDACYSATTAPSHHILLSGFTKDKANSPGGIRAVCHLEFGGISLKLSDSLSKIWEIWRQQHDSRWLHEEI